MDWHRVTPFMVCPACQRAGLQVSDTALLCGCGSRYPLLDGVADFLGTPEVKDTFTMRLMHSGLLTRIYEGLWRRLTWPFTTAWTLDEEIDQVLSLHSFLPGARVLDVACGPGTFSRPFSRRVGTDGVVVGVDVSMPMLREGIRRARGEGLKNLFLIRADGQHLPFLSESFDAVSCAAALHLLPDVPTALRGFQAVLRRGGHFTAVTFRRSGLAPLNYLARKAGLTLFEPEGLWKSLRGAGLELELDLRSRLMLIFSARRASSGEEGSREVD